MARSKRKAKPREPDKRPPASEAAVEEGIEALTEAFEMSKTLRNSIDSNEDSYNKRLFEKAADVNDLGSADKARKLYRLGDEEAGFSEQAVEEIFELARESRHVLKVTALLRLLAIPKTESRLAAARQMVRGRWTQSQVEAEVRSRPGGRGPQTAGGRKPRLPRTKKEMVEEFSQLANRWRRYHTEVTGTKFWTDLDEESRRAVEAVSKTMTDKKF